VETCSHRANFSPWNRSGVAETEGHCDLFQTSYRATVQYGWPVTPLSNGIDGGWNQQSRSTYDLHAFNYADLIYQNAQYHGALDVCARCLNREARLPERSQFAN
jgi:hypothetical protein